MRLAMPSDDQQSLSPHVGRCSGFLVIEITDGAVSQRQWRPNTFTGHARGEHDHGHHGAHAGRHARVLAALSDCQILVAGGMGARLHQDLVEAGITAYTTDLTRVDDVVEAVIAGALADQPERRCSHDHEPPAG